MKHKMQLKLETMEAFGKNVSRNDFPLRKAPTTERTATLVFGGIYTTQ
jgi:hypothetical protein